MLKTSLFTLSFLASATLAFAQNTNQAAVDTLTKEVAKVVFAKINQPKAQDIYNQLLTCGDGCDPQTVIRAVGGWDAVGAKMQELSTLKDTQPFIAMSPEAANAAIRQQLAQFYTRYKSDNNYGKPLSPAVQTQIMTKINGILPPAATEPTTTSDNPSDAQVAADDESSITPSALQLSKLEREVKEAQEKQIWMMLLAGIIGLLAGAGAVYFLLYRAATGEVQRLNAENLQLSKAVDAARRPKPTNEPRQPQDDFRQKANAYDAILAELNTDNPLAAIRRLKQQSANKLAEPTPETRPVSPPIDLVKEPEPVPEPVQMQSPLTPLPPLEPLPPLNRSEVFYFPPPDPNGQFDLAQKSSTLSPESAYRFAVDADNSAVASFRFEADPGRLARFLTYRNYMIEPACESENSYTAAHTRVAMRRDGQAVLDNGVWRVKTKALIRYE